MSPLDRVTNAFIPSSLMSTLKDKGSCKQATSAALSAAQQKPTKVEHPLSKQLHDGVPLLLQRGNQKPRKGMLLSQLHNISYSLLLFYDMLQPRNHQLRRQGPEAKPHAPGLQGWDDLREVVADQAKPGVLGELLNHWGSKREAGIGVPLELQSSEGLCGHME